jgi:hypothetical protein
MFEDYVHRCRRKEVRIGMPYLYKDPTIWILNFPTKYHWRYNSRFEWIEEGLNYFRDNYKEFGIDSIAFPKLGCDRGGLDWGKINNLMEKYLENLDIDIYICLNELERPNGIEKEMTDYLNKLSLNKLMIELKIRKPIAMKIKDHLPLKRFRELLFIEGVGKKTYENLFRHIYNEIALKIRDQRGIDELVAHNIRSNIEI